MSRLSTIGTWFARVLLGLILLLFILFWIAVWIYRDIPREELEARYANQASQFITVDGVRFHYRDEGLQDADAPVLVLIHANFASLLGWEPWVEGLRDDFRILRFDLTSHGLTGPDPTDDYTMERTMALTEQLFQAWGLQRFSLAGTSVGGTVAMRYTAQYPEQVEKLILLSPGALEGRQQVAERGDSAWMLRIFEFIMPRAVPEAMLRMGYGQPENLADSVVDRWYDLWRLEGQRRAQIRRLSAYVPGDIESVVRAIQVPTLLLWGEENRQAHLAQAPVFKDLLENAEYSYLIVYPGIGHMAVQEDGAAMVDDVRAFLLEDRAYLDQRATDPQSIADQAH